MYNYTSIFIMQLNFFTADTVRVIKSTGTVQPQVHPTMLLLPASICLVLIDSYVAVEVLG